MNIAEIMVPKVNTTFLHRRSTVRQGLEIMNRHGYTAVPVLDEEERYIGSVTEGDFLRCVLANGTTDLKAYEKSSVGELVRRDFCPALHIDAVAADVILAVLNQNYVPVVDGRNCLCGIITRRNVIASLANMRYD